MIQRLSRRTPGILIVTCCALWSVGATPAAASITDLASLEALLLTPEEAQAAANGVAIVRSDPAAPAIGNSCKGDDTGNLYCYRAWAPRGQGTYPFTMKVLYAPNATQANREFSFPAGYRPTQAGVTSVPIRGATDIVVLYNHSWGQSSWASRVRDRVVIEVSCSGEQSAAQACALAVIDTQIQKLNNQLPAPKPPSVPRDVTATINGNLASISWTQPESDGGRSVKSYTVTSVPTGVSCSTPHVGASNYCNIAQLPAGTTYSFVVTAENEIGRSEASAPTTAVRATQPPGAPARLRVQAMSGEIQVSWSAPGDSGGAPVSQYKAVAKPGGLVCLTRGTRCAITGVKAGRTYELFVFATNAAGMGAHSKTVTVKIPKAPSRVTRPPVEPPSPIAPPAEPEKPAPSFS